MQFPCQQKGFSTQFTAKYTDILHFVGVSCQKRIKMNIFTEPEMQI